MCYMAKVIKIIECCIFQHKRGEHLAYGRLFTSLLLVKIPCNVITTIMDYLLLDSQRVWATHQHCIAICSGI